MLRRCVLQLVEDDMSAPRRGARAARRGTFTLANAQLSSVDGACRSRSTDAAAPRIALRGSRQHEPDVGPMGSLRRTYRCGAVNRESYGEREASHDGTEGWSARAAVREALRR
jgi:hypothetical protein